MLVLACVLAVHIYCIRLFDAVVRPLRQVLIPLKKELFILQASGLGVSRLSCSHELFLSRARVLVRLVLLHLYLNIVLNFLLLAPQEL